MKVSQHKLIFGILQCAIFMLILVVYILSGFVTFTHQWKAHALLARTNNMITPVKNIYTGGGTETCNKVQSNRTVFQTDKGYLLLNKTIYFCKVPKCASTFMGIFLRKLFSIEKGQNSNYIFKIKNIVNISNLYTFMFVREPYGRILSAYQNKLFLPSSLFAKIGTEIIKEVRQNASAISLRYGHDVTFTELIQYIVNSYNKGRTLNPHITAIHTLCNPNLQKFNLIGKVETMTTDLVQLINEWKTLGLISEEMKSADEIESEIQNHLPVGPVAHMFQFYYKNKDWISKYKLFQRTWASYQIQGKILKEYKLPFNESYVEHVTYEIYTEVLETALNVSKKHRSKLKDQRREVLHKAYRSVPVKLLEKLSKYLKTDCKLFCYENRPGWIFNEQEWTPLSGHDYFQWL